MADMEGVDVEVQVVVAHRERATLRVGDVFLKVDGDRKGADREVEAMRRAPVPTPEVLWHRHPVLALAALPGTPIARLGESATTSATAWAAAGRVVRTLHEAPLPPWPGRSLGDDGAELARECEWLVRDEVLPRDLVLHSRTIAEAVLRPFPPVFMHGDLQVAHVFVEGDDVTGVLDWSEAGRGDATYDLASLTLGHREHLDDVLRGYGAEVDREAIRGWWALRSLTAIRWLTEHGFDPFLPGCEVDVLRALAGDGS
jgi:aminoglycoside phosphotransferase (APT) family kinase protein